MNSKITISDFSPHLFWDVDAKKIDFEKHKEQLVYKVLEYGLLKDWHLLNRLYKRDEIKNIVLNIRSLDVVTLSFCSTIFKIDKKEFRCYKHRQLVKNVWNS